MHHACWTILLANATTDAEIFIYNGIAPFPDADGIFGACFYAYPARHTAVFFIDCFILSHTFILLCAVVLLETLLHLPHIKDIRVEHCLYLHLSAFGIV